MYNPQATFVPVMTVDLDALAFNLRSIASQAQVPVSSVIAVVKDNAYGLGMIPVARRLQREGVSHFAVAHFDAAVRLREAGIEGVILHLGPLEQEELPLATAHQISLSINDPTQLSLFARFREELPLLHCMIDTGMARNGFSLAQLKSPSVRADLQRLRNKIVGVYTHFHSADEIDTTSVTEQRDLFSQGIALLEKEGINLTLRHAANSAAAQYFAIHEGEYIRPGISLYGCRPDPQRPVPNPLRAVVEITTKIATIREVSPGQGVGYGHAWVSTENCVIATVPIGYGLGYPRALSHKGVVLIQGEKFPVVGRVTMDFLLINLGQRHNIQVGELVTIVGRNGSASLSVDELASLADTIGYELLCRFGAHLSRDYLEGGEKVWTEKRVIQ